LLQVGMAPAIVSACLLTAPPGLRLGQHRENESPGAPRSRRVPVEQMEKISVEMKQGLV